jgi:hypothetical protein
VSLTLQRVAQPRTVKNGMHLDPLGGNLEAEVRRARSAAFDSFDAQGDTGGVLLHDPWDDEDDRPEPDLTDPLTVAALARAARDVRLVKLIHLALVAVGIGLLALALLLHMD